MPDYNDLATTYATTTTVGTYETTTPDTATATVARNTNGYLYIDNNYNWNPVLNAACLDINTDYIKRIELDWKLDELARKIYKVIKESARLDIDEDDFIRMLQDAN